MINTIEYIIDFLAKFPVSKASIVQYCHYANVSENAKIIIIPAFDNLEIDHLPKVPFKKINETPILFGEPRIEKKDKSIIVYADIIASSFFMLSRYEEILSKKSRDKHGRFLAKDSIIFQQGYGNMPLVDEYSKLLREWLREMGVNIPIDKGGIRKIYLTHDVDNPFRFERFSSVLKQYIKNILKVNYYNSPLKKYFYKQLDDYFTFPKIIDYDKKLEKKLCEVPVESIYFFITAGSRFNKKYYNIFSKKIKYLISTLIKSDAKFGIHLSHEAGKNPKRISMEVQRFKYKFKHEKIYSRHHYLKWNNSEDIVFMEKAGVTDDFTMAYPDVIGFRVGTCQQYRFINPLTKELTNIIIHPLNIMDVTLAQYMNLDYDNAFEKCKEIINQVYKHNGELNLLWHNDTFVKPNDFEWLYINVLNYIGLMKLC